MFISRAAHPTYRVFVPQFAFRGCSKYDIVHFDVDDNYLHPSCYVRVSITYRLRPRYASAFLKQLEIIKGLVENLPWHGVLLLVMGESSRSIISA